MIVTHHSQISSTLHKILLIFISGWVSVSVATTTGSLLHAYCNNVNTSVTYNPVQYCGMVDDTKQIRKSCNLRCVFHRGMIKMMVSFPVFSVVVCAWSKTRQLCGRLASVGLAQAHPNNIDHSTLAHTRGNLMDEKEMTSH